MPVSVNKTLLLREPLPCNPAAETAIQPLIWCSESQHSNVYSFREECFFTDTRVYSQRSRSFLTGYYEDTSASSPPAANNIYIYIYMYIYAYAHIYLCI